jgi:hypothetical protein
VNDNKYFKVLQPLAKLQVSPSASSQPMWALLGAINRCINALIYMGFLKMSNIVHSDNGLKYVYLLIPKGIAEKLRSTKTFLQRKLVEYENLRVETDELQALSFEDSPLVNLKNLGR